MIIVKGRELLIPNNERYIGTTYDDNSTVRTFRIPRFHEDGMDKSQLDFYVIINYDDGSDPDAVGVVKAVNDDYIVLEWDVGEDVTEHSGCLYLWVRGFDYTGTIRWSSFPGVFYIEGSGTEPSNLSDLEQRISEEDRLLRLAKLYKSQPMTAATVSEMTDRESIYVYVGSEDGYTYGNWYFWDGSAWVSGGVYNAVAVQTDTSLTQENMAADAKAVGDEFADLEIALDGDPYQMPYIPGSGTSVAWQDMYVTPQMFGALADGVTDDSAALQAAIDSGRSVFLPDGTYLIESTVTISSDVTIFGSRDKSVLKFTGDGVLTTNGNLCNVRLDSFAVYVSKASGNAIEIIRENTVVAERALRITCVDFVFDNSLTGSTANMLYLYGVREGIISNCFFCGDTATAVSGISAIYAVGDSAHLTMNISISECVFAYVGYAINAVADEGNALYLAGFRIANNSFIGCGYGVRCIFFDTPTISYNMIDYCAVPIYCGASSNVTIIGNYVQTAEEGACIVIENLAHIGAESNINISDNTIHSSNTEPGSASTITDGIQLIGYDSPLIIRYVTIRGNTIYRVKYAVVLTNVKYANIADNHVFYATRFVANSNAESIRIHDNYVQSDVTSFATSIGTMWDVAQNQWGARYTGGVASGTQEYTVAAGSSESYDITFSGSGHVYYSVPAVSVAFKDVGTTWEGMYLAITSVSMTGFTVKVINSGSASHTNVIRWTAVG